MKSKINLCLSSRHPAINHPKITRIQRNHSRILISLECNAAGDCEGILDKVKTWDAALIGKMKLSE